MKITMRSIQHKDRGDHKKSIARDHKHEHVHKKNDTHEKFEKINLSKDKQKSHSEKLLESKLLPC